MWMKGRSFGLLRQTHLSGQRSQAQGQLLRRSGWRIQDDTYRWWRIDPRTTQKGRQHRRYEGRSGAAPSFDQVQTTLRVQPIYWRQSVAQKLHTLIMQRHVTTPLGRPNLFSQNVQKLLDQKAMVTLCISQRSCASQSFILDCLILIHL